jgi:hypothetical protein
MAGQGWREWTAGEQLTDAKMQQFLQDQAVMRFSNASARTTALTGVVSEGMVTYLDDTNTVEVWDGSEWTELTGDPDIFTQGTAGQYLASLGTAGVEWSDIGEAQPYDAGLHYGRAGQFSIFNANLADTSWNVALGPAASAGTAQPSSGGLIGNTTIGGNTGRIVTTGHNNVIVGGEAGGNLTTGSFNVFVGTSAAQAQQTSSGNTIVGHGGAFSYIEMTDCTMIGQTAGGQAGFLTSTGTNLTMLGNGAIASGTAVSNQITLGNSAITSLRCAVTSITALSDERDKKNIQPLNYGLDLIERLNPVSFDWNTRDGQKVGVKDFGFIAQDLAEVEDSLDAERLALTLRDNPDKLEASPGRLIPILVKAVQELSARVQELENAR